MNEPRSPADAIRAFGEAYSRPAPHRFSPELVAAMRAFSRTARDAAERGSRAVVKMAESAKR